MSFDNGIYPAFVESRTKCVVDEVVNGFFTDKTILEAGCGYGYAGELFERLGAVVTSCDARKEHIDVVKKRYPHRNTFVCDLNNDKIKRKFDIVLAFGILYHLENPRHFLNQCGTICETLILETIVRDSDSLLLTQSKADTSFDQAITNKAVVPTVGWLDNALMNCGFRYVDISNATANAPGNVFDWKSLNHGKDNRDGAYLRKMYLAAKE